MSYDLESILNYIDSSSKKLIAVLGPTCTGKSDIAIAIAKHIDAEIINCDSRLIFQQMNIGTAKPSEEELGEVKHHLVNIRKPDEIYSAANYRKDFDEIIDAHRDADGNLNKKFVVVGGTGLYAKAALENLNMPETGSNTELREEVKAKETEELAQMLKELDPKAYLQVDMDNKVRLIGAIELVKDSGKTLAQIRSKASEDRYDTCYLALNFERRRALYDLINARVIRMIRKGLVHEVEALLNKYGETQTLMSTIGYKEIISYLKGEKASLSEARREIQLKTRRYAKKQMTWFRANPKIKWFYRD